jgi:hypothetical protein
MALSKNVVATLVDLIQNKLSVMQIGDRDDLREVLVLQHCLTELRGLGGAEAAEPRTFEGVPRRGRRRKVSAIMEDLRDEIMRQQA